MTRTFHRVLGIIALTAGMTTATADPLTVAAGDTTTSILAAHAGKRVTLKLRSGEEISGTIAMAGDSVVHLRELVGREFFDAAVATNGIDAVIVRTRDR